MPIGVEIIMKRVGFVYAIAALAGAGALGVACRR
jgi:hypothetical protein